MIYIEFGQAELQTMEVNSMFLRFNFSGGTFNSDLEKIRGFWNRIYNSKTKEWEVPYTEEILEEIQKLYNNEITYLNEKPRRKTDADINKLLDNYNWGKFKPYPYQLEGIKFGLRHRNWILGDTMGLGKSFQTIHLANIYKQTGKIRHCLVVCCINSLKYNWLNEIKKFTDEGAVILGTRYGKTEKTKDKLMDISIEETKQQIDTCPSEFFWIINVEKIRSKERGRGKLNNNDEIVDHLNRQILQGNLGMIIVDEIHMCKNPSSNQSKELQRIDDTAIKVGMSGTLVVNNPLDLYVPMNITGILSMNYKVFDRRYVIRDMFGGVYGYQNMGELQSILHKAFIRRTKEEVAKDLPPVIINNEILELSPEEQRVFEEITKQDYYAEEKKELEQQQSLFGDTGYDTIYDTDYIDKVDAPSTIMSVITRLRQCVTHTGLISTKIQKSTKFERLKDYLDEAKLNNEKVLVFCQFTQAIDLAMDYFAKYNPKKIVGGMGQGIAKVVEEHENTDGFSVIFAQTQTLGVGYSLPNTTNVIFLTVLWDYATFEQCYNRCHRITSTKPVTVTNLIMKNTYDETIYDKIYAKKAMGDVIIDEKEINACVEYIKKLKVQFIEGKASKRITLEDIVNKLNKES